MPITFNPLTDTVVKTEFVGGSQTVTVVNDTTVEFEIKNVDGTNNPNAISYSVANGRTYPDMTINHTASSFTFNSTYDYTFDRLTKYVYQPTPTGKEFYEVSSPHLLPPNDPAHPQITKYQGIYQVSPPPVELMTVTWTVQGRERTITPGDPMAVPPTSTAYGPWYAKSYTWTMDVAYDFNYTATAIKNAVKLGEGYKKAVIDYPEIAL